MPPIRDMIIVILDENGGEIHGMNQLAELLNASNYRSWIRQRLEAMETIGEIRIVRTNGGRGHKNIIRKRNPNSAGSPRRVRRT